MKTISTKFQITADLFGFVEYSYVAPPREPEGNDWSEESDLPGVRTTLLLPTNESGELHGSIRSYRILIGQVLTSEWGISCDDYRTLSFVIRERTLRESYILGTKWFNDTVDLLRGIATIRVPRLRQRILTIEAAHADGGDLFFDDLSCD